MNAELQELKDLWRQHDEKLDRQVKLNVELLKKIEFKNVRSALRKAVVDPIIGLIFGAIMFFSLMPFTIDHLHQPKFLIPALFMVLYAVLLIIDSIYRLSRIGQTDYDGPVTHIQRHIEQMRIHNLRYTVPLNCSWALMWFLVPIVALKGLGNFDIYTLDHGWLVWNFVICGALGIAFIALSVWLSRRYGADQITRPWLKNVADNLAGQSLSDAKASLAEIDRFAREQ